MANNYYEKNKEKLQNEAHERYQNLSEGKKNIKSANMLVIDIADFLKKKKKRSVNIVVNDIRII